MDVAGVLDELMAEVESSLALPASGSSPPSDTTDASATDTLSPASSLESASSPTSSPESASSPPSSPESASSPPSSPESASCSGGSPEVARGAETEHIRVGAIDLFLTEAAEHLDPHSPQEGPQSPAWRILRPAADRPLGSDEPSDDAAASSPDVKAPAHDPLIVISRMSLTKVENSTASRIVRHGIVRSSLSRAVDLARPPNDIHYRDHVYNFETCSPFVRRGRFLADLDAIVQTRASGRRVTQVVAVGATEGKHLPLLASLFPRVEFTVYDARPYKLVFDESTQPARGRMTMFHRQFTDEDAEYWRYQTGVVFICAEKDAKTAARWTAIMMPNAAQLRMCLPLPPAKEPAYAALAPVQYPRGQVRLHPWAEYRPDRARLYVHSDPEAPDLVSYDSRSIVDALHWQHIGWREWGSFAHVVPVSSAKDAPVPGLCSCFDCALEVSVWQDYVRVVRPSSGAGEIAALMRRTGAALNLPLNRDKHGIQPLPGLQSHADGVRRTDNGLSVRRPDGGRQERGHERGHRGGKNGGQDSRRARTPPARQGARGPARQGDKHRRPPNHSAAASPLVRGHARPELAQSTSPPTRSSAGPSARGSSARSDPPALLLSAAVNAAIESVKNSLPAPY
jgi:hypothetical protein